VQASYAALPLAFEQNQGQTGSQVKYVARGSGYTLFLTANDAVFSLHPRSTDGKSAGHNPLMSQASNRHAQNDTAAVVHMQLAGGNARAQISASSQLPGVSNYFLGNDPNQWRTRVPHYARVSYRDVYPGVNLAFHGAQRQVEFDFVIAAGANPAPIGFALTGANSMNTDDAGNLVIASAAGNVLLHKPVAYQERNGARQPVDARFIVKANRQVGFELGAYDRTRELVIDPTVSYAYSTYLGGTGDDEGYGIAFDSNGNAYVTGQTASNNFPGTTGGLSGTANVFVTKIAAGGASLVYSTYVGGEATDSGNGIAVDSSGDAFVTGFTTSALFPATTGAFQKTIAGSGGNAFVFELNPAGSVLSYCTYLGGGGDVAYGIAIDSTGDAYVTGRTASGTFPTASPLQAYVSGSASSAFVTELNSSGSALVYSTYLGGGALDFATAIALDSSNNAYVTGQTSNPTFPTKNPLQSKCGTDGTCNGGLSDAFVTVINAQGSAYIYSTFLGGSGGDSGSSIAVDSFGNAYVTGSTESSDFPRASALQSTYGGNGDAFVAKLNATGSALVYSTYLGGSQFDIGSGIAVDGGGNAYITGSTASSSGFLLQGATQGTYGGGTSDAFVSEINSTGSALNFSTYLGGSLDENAGNFGAVAVDGPGGSIYVTGTTSSTAPGGFPTSSPFQAANAGGSDAFVTQYQQVTFDLTATTPAPVAAGTSATSTVTLTSVNGYSSAVTLSCAVTGTGTPPPACSASSSFSPGSVTPTSSGATSALTITTTPANAAMFTPRSFYYATWLPVAGLSLVGVGFSSTRSRRKKLLGLMMLGMVMATLILLPACGGSSSGGGGGGGGGGGTPAGAYTVTITGAGADGTTQTYPITVTVN